MSKIYDEQVDFTTTSVSTNQKDAASIQPIVGGENLWENVLNRTPENLRVRSEALRTAVEDLKYYADYDRAFVLRAEATTFQCTSETDGYVLAMTNGPLWIYPALTPGQNSGGRIRGARMFVQNGSWVPYAGTPGTNDLTFIASGQYTGMRGYAESDDMAAGSFTVGGNRLMISLVANPAAVGGPSSISATVTGAPATLITITYGTLTTATTINDLLTWITGDLNSQGSYGLAHMIRGFTTSAGTSALPAITNGVFQGGYDAEAHKITDFSSFFNVLVGSVYVNRLQEGEGLALSFVPGPVEASTGASGGRRQALLDLPTDRIGGNNDNSLSNTILFNTGREPEKIPGSIPIGKLVNGKFVFIDGTVIGTAPLSLGESGVTLGRLAASTGATMIGYDGSGNWNPDANASPNPALVSTTVGAALDEIVTQLGKYAAADSGARRIGMEGVYGSASAGNTALDLVSGITSLRNALTQILNAVGSAAAPGGVNARVSEYGHRMQGFNPIEKVFSATTPVDTTGGGAQMIRAVLNPPVNAAYGAQVEEQAAIYLQPYLYDAGANNTLSAAEGVTFVSGAIVQVTAMNATRAGHLRDNIVPNLDGGYVSPHCVVYLSGVTPGSGYYFVSAFNDVNQHLTLMSLDGSTPNFTSATFSTATVSFFRTRIVGNSQAGVRVRSMVPGLAAASDTEYFGDGGIHVAFAANGAYRHMLSAAKAQWGIDGVSRDTDNILVTGDKTLLDGAETGTAVDATASHHHGSSYTQFIPLIVSPAAYEFPYMATTPGSLYTLATPPTGKRYVAALLRYELTVTSTGAGPVAATFYFTDNSGSSEPYYLALHEFTASGASETHTFQGNQLLIPLVSGQLCLVRGPTLNVELVATEVQIHVAGFFADYT